jgi:hypothetical protein
VTPDEAGLVATGVTTAAPDPKAALETGMRSTLRGRSVSLSFADMLRKAMSSVARCRSGEIWLVVGVLRRGARMQQQESSLCGYGGGVDGRGWAHVAEVILCDM